MYIKKNPINTRGRPNTKTKFKLMTKYTGKYLGSPLYRGSILWDKLEKEVQHLPTIRQFSNVYYIVRNCRIYKDLLT